MINSIKLGEYLTTKELGLIKLISYCGNDVYMIYSISQNTFFYMKITKRTIKLLTRKP